MRRLLSFMAIFVSISISVFIFSSCGGSGGSGGTTQPSQPTPSPSPNPQADTTKANISVEGLNPGESLTMSGIDTEGNNINIRIDKNGNISLEGLKKNSGLRLELSDFPKGRVCVFKERASTVRVIYVGAYEPQLSIVCIDKLPLPDLRVNSSLTPTVSSIPGRNGAPARAVGVIDTKNGKAEVVMGELIVSAENRALVEGIVSRWNGKILKTIEVSKFGNLTKGDIYLISVDVSKVNLDIDELKRLIQEANPVATGMIETSNEDLLKLLYIAAKESEDRRVDISLNYVTRAASDLLLNYLSQGEVREGVGPSDRGYRRNVFDWPYMRPGGSLDINVVGAWIALAANNALNANPGVNVVIFDGGFLSRSNYTHTASISMLNEDERNTMSCTAGTPCPWHGTLVANILAGEPGDGTLVAGIGAPVIERLRMYGWTSADIVDIIEYIAGAIGEIILAGVDITSEFRAHIINMSGAKRIPAGIAWLTNGITDALGTYARVNGILPIAAAGNDGENVDAVDCFIACWEEATWIPCEVSGVMCVGGVDWGGRIASSSNYGTRGGDVEALLEIISRAIGSVMPSFSLPGGDTVDIWAPYTLYAPNIDPSGALDFPPVTEINGTSFSAPFTAGVAALVWRALHADETLRTILKTPVINNFVDDLVEAILFTRASRNVSGRESDHVSNRRLVQAYDSVWIALSLGGLDATKDYVKILLPARRRSVKWRSKIELQGMALPDPLTLNMKRISWSSSIDGDIGQTDSYERLDWIPDNPGEHTITAKVGSAEASITIDVINHPPEVLIVNPSPDERDSEGFIKKCLNYPVTFTARVSDPNNSPNVEGDFPFPEENIKWRAETLGASENLPSGKTISHTFTREGVYTVTVVAKDEMGLEGSDYIERIKVETCPTAPPRISVIAPEGGYARVNTFSELPITLRAQAIDPEDGDISSSIRWYMDGREIGRGATIVLDENDLREKIPVTASTTEVYIILKVKDSSGVEVSQSILLELYTPVL